ncbi:MAG: FtsW/RodA/SpoVE family cell cycle protein [Erysipelotrichaceae bacterium]|nr:FtsW/RodA/SpoVE family cell cycle protein [Erysipelotrichaceae bacterium]
MRKVFSKMDKPLLFVGLTFFLFGLVMVLSASSMESYMRYGYGPYHYFYRQAIFLALGMILFLIIIRIPTKVYQWFSYVFMIGIIGVLIVLTVYGHISNNAQSWFKIGGISIQPSEFAKVISIVFLSCYYGKNRENLDKIKTLILPIIPVMIIFGLILIQPDLGTALIVGLIAFLMFFSLPMPRKLLKRFQLFVIGILVCVIGVYVITDGKILKDYQKERFNFRDPCERYQEDSGYQLCNSFIAFKNGGFTGQGIGKSTQKYLYLPESYTDFIFPIIVEEWGLWVGILLILIYLFVIYRLYRIARRAINLQCSLMAYGVCVYVFLHVVINLVGVMGIGPLTGVPLPFLSYGGSYVISLMIALALAERVSIESSNQLKKKGRGRERKKVN